MFTWICPQCGREVPPAYNECPDCAPKAAGPAPAPAAEPAPPPSPTAAAPPPPAYQPAPAPYAAPEPRAPPAPLPAAFTPPPVRPRAAGPVLPTWLLAILFALAFLGLGAGIYWLVGAARGRSQAAPAASVESPAAKPGAVTNPFQKFVEVAGIRFTEDPKHKDKTLVKFVLINHSEADITGLAGNVTIWGRTRQSEEDAQGTFSFSANVGPYESKELTAPLNTKLKIYELGDWQNLTNDLQITAPGGASPGSAAPR